MLSYGNRDIIYYYKMWRVLSSMSCKI